MCTVIVHVPDAPGESVHVLAVRDEDPARAWDPPGAWWPERPQVLGVRDRRAGGAWLAADPGLGRLAVLLNRADVLPADATPPSRGAVALDAVAGRVPAEGSRPELHGFNLVDVDGGRVRVSSWDGSVVRQGILAPGTHMIAHDDVDDPATARVVRWLPAFAAAAPRPGEAGWFAPWLALLQRSTEVGSTDDTAIVRDNRPHGYPTLSLLVCTATVGAGTVDLAWSTLQDPGHWNEPNWH